MSNFSYEFLTYESFPEDQYILEIVEVCICGAVILPYTHLKMKDGSAFWGFPGCGATKNGVKKRFNGLFDSQTLKRKFESDLKAFISCQVSKGVVTQDSVFNGAATSQNASIPYPQGYVKAEVAAEDQGLPF